MSIKERGGGGGNAFERRCDAISRTHQNKIHMIYESFVVKSSVNWMLLEIRRYFICILNISLSRSCPIDWKIGRETNFIARGEGQTRCYFGANPSSFITAISGQNGNKL